MEASKGTILKQESKHNRNWIQEIDGKAFELLPHTRMYDDKREAIGLVDWSATDRPEWSYEEFDYELDRYCELEGERGIKALAKRLKRIEREQERIEKGINLACDISEFPEPDWLVEGFIVRNGLTLLYGDSGTGKTTLCLYLADRMQKSKDFFGLECKQGKVLFVENDESGELLRSHRDKVGLPESLLVANTDIIWDASNSSFNEQFAELLYYYIPDVVVIDAYTSLGIPDITRPESALVLDELRRLAKSYHCAMVIIHHTNKAGEQMGSSLHRAKMDSMVCLSKISENRIMLTQEKIRGSKFQPKGVNFDQDTLEMRDANTSLKQQVLELASLGIPDNEIIAKFSKQHRGSVRRYLRDGGVKARISKNPNS